MFNQYQKSYKTPFIIYADLESLIEKIDGCENNHATKIGGHILSGFSLPTILSYQDIENRYHAYRGKNCMTKFCKSLTEHAIKIANFKR